MDDTKTIERQLFLKIEDEILKIKVIVNSVKLKELAADICDNCSVIKHIEKRYIDEDFNFEDERRYRNLEIIVISNGYKDPIHNEDRPRIVDVSFDEYDFPLIVDDLTNISNGKFGGKYGFKLSFKYEKNKYDYLLKRIDDIEKQISEISNDDSISNSIKIKKLYILSSKLSELCEVDVRIPDNNITDYYDSILECFSVEKVETIPSEYINSIFNYLNFLNKEELDSYIVNIESMDSILATWLMDEIKKEKTLKKIKAI